MAKEQASDKIQSKEEDLEKMMELNSLMEEMVRDASALSRDLIEVAGAIGGAAALLLTIVIIEILIILVNLGRDPLFTGALILTSIPMLVYGIILLRKFFELRERYARLYEINKQLEK
jgi:hypothetical protein